MTSSSKTKSRSAAKQPPRAKVARTGLGSRLPALAERVPTKVLYALLRVRRLWLAAVRTQHRCGARSSQADLAFRAHLRANTKLHKLVHADDWGTK